MKTAYEYIVLGCGGLGSGALYWLARVAGREVLGLEQFELGHHRGGSQDHSRIIRLSYHSPDYTALAPHTYTCWAEVEAESGVQLVVKTGGLDVGPRGQQAAKALENYAAAMTRHGIPFEDLSAEEAMRRWPQWHLEPQHGVLYQKDSGLVDAKKGNAVHVALARARGATVLDHTPVRRIRPVGDTVELDTDAGTFACRRLVICGGSWTDRLLRPLGVELRLTVTQEQVTYYATPNLRDFAPDRFPIWIWHGVDESYYGFPVYGEVATKAGQDVGGRVVTPDTRTFDVDQAAFDRLHRFLAARLPGSLGPVLYTKTCLYDMPPDRNFILDTLPEHPQIAVANGAAHGYKFASLIGRIMSELATEGRTRYPIAPFSLNRPALKDPAAPRQFLLVG